MSAVGKPAHTFCRCGHHFYHWALRQWIKVQADGASVVADWTLTCIDGRGPEWRRP